MRPAESSSDGFETSGNGHATLPLTEASGSDHQVDATVQDESSHVSDLLGPASSPEDVPATIGRYRVVSLLGSGGFGAVYLARDEKLTRDVSIKVPHRHRVRTPEHLQRYMREARLVAGLDHAKIVPVYDVGETENGMCYVVSKYIESETLADRVKQDTSPNEALDIVIDLAETLQFVHEQGIVHRDVKPSNVLVDRDGTLFLNDFGLAMSEVTVSERGALIGTPSYMSPEQAFGEGHLVDGRSDVFSLGVMLYEMLSGRRPFRGGSTEQILYQIRNLEPKPLRQRKRDLPVALERVCQKALSKKPGGRYASAIDLAEDLAQVRERFGPSNWSGSANSSIDLAVSSTSNRVRLVDHGSAGGSSGLSGNASNSDDASVVVIPKGLRSYDQSDARFFKAMLPGPYDMDGCPESILFWKHRIDVSQTAVDPFRVGVIYGTSGCGKSSFVRAGLIPILENSVRVCLIDATRQGTTQRLTQSLSRLVPTFDAPATSDMPLPDRFASIRRGENLPSGQKVLIVIYQFEQWLNGADDDQRAELTLALRQCDGHRLQTILLVRDDFWLATSRLMRDLDIELSASHNLAMIDLLDQPHAARLLRMLGRAYGRIGSEDVRLKREQRHFIRDAVTALSSGGRVIAVQLALFAEMMKSRPWTRASLRSLHGVDRIVEQFLHESFDAPSAPKEQRIHQAAAHRLLAAMLPETGLIRGGSISRADLMKASGYDESPELMSDLTQILDTRLKLITEVESGEGAVDRKSTRYQLTHDTLIPALRRWLMRHENGSMRGRAKGQLRHRSNAYAERDDRRQLPSMFQWAQFGLLVRRRDWTPAERRMMHAAGRMHGVLIALLLFVAGALWFGYRESRSRAVASSLVSQLMVATPTQLPETLRRID
ncbi:MAG: serine/threonine-protein kinase, partial [Planctomycetota bacterium]